MVIPQTHVRGHFSIVGSFPSVTFWIWRVRMFSFPDANWFYSVVVSHLVVPFENFIGICACSDGIGGCSFTVGCTRRWNHDGDWELFATHWKNSANKMSQKGFFLIQVMRFAFSHYRGRCVGWRRALRFSVNEEFWSEDILPNRRGKKTQWIGWLNWGFRSWPLIRFVMTRKWKSQSRKGNSGFFVPKTAQGMTVAQNSAYGVEKQNQQRSNSMRWERC